MTGRTPFFRLSELMAIGGGGALGSLLRAWIHTGSEGAFPLSTLAVNLLGSLALILLHLREHHLPLHHRHLWLAGFCGSFTTVSLFSLQTVELARSGHPGLAVLYLLVSLLPALLLGLLLMRLHPYPQSTGSSQP